MSCGRATARGRGSSTTPCADGLLLPFNRASRNADGSVKEPRYYQRTAINRSVEAILRGDKRLLLTMATGTGKTFVSMQIVWKLWKSDWRRGPQAPHPLPGGSQHPDRPASAGLFQAGVRRGPRSGTSRARRKPVARSTSRCTRRSATAARISNGIFREFAPDFFDLIIVDECHRGSARQTSSWRTILEHFSSATQLGMTATPKRDETVDSYEYFGEPLFDVLAGAGHRRRLPRSVPGAPRRAQP